jgi:ketosteroid isomerase-like protein
MNTALSKLVKDSFQAVEAKDIEAVLNCFTDDAQLIDPHYPKVQMKGKEEIRAGLTWGFKGLKKLGFTIEKYFESEDGKSVAIEVATAHVLPNGKPLNFPQVFMIDIEEGKISRMQSYVPYGSHGMLKIILGVARLSKKFRH